MTLFLDTSALVKLYISETDTEKVEWAVQQAERVVVCVTAYTEARAALARLYREQALSTTDFTAVKLALERDWQNYTRLAVDETLAALAGGLAERYALRGFDAVHLAAALAQHRDTGDVLFLAFDKRLSRAATQVLPLYV
ncbi:type II toxin-antitoxin system VapC family toxin [soil metagenome]